MTDRFDQAILELRAALKKSRDSYFDGADWVALEDAAESAIFEYYAAKIVMSWQPIETAPKDGSEFLGWFPGSTVMIWWMGQGGVWGNDFWEGEAPTHWMPLPNPPAL